MSVAIIDYGMCNLGSVRRAFEECGADAKLIDRPEELESADKIILPGVGAFTRGMANLRDRGWIGPIRENVLNRKKPLLGICLGMQLLADRGEEGGGTEGLGLVSGSVVRLHATSHDQRIPHMGWNEIQIQRSNPLFGGIASGTDFYFVHSFHFEVLDPTSAITKTPYCGNFVSAVQRENIFGVQFHPEKSQKPGFQLIRNFLQEC